MRCKVLFLLGLRSIVEDSSAKGCRFILQVGTMGEEIVYEVGSMVEIMTVHGKVQRVCSATAHEVRI